MTEECRVPDSMVGLSECAHTSLTISTIPALLCFGLNSTLLCFPLKSLAEGVNRLIKFSKTLAARSRLHMVSCNLLSQQCIVDIPASPGLIIIVVSIHR